MDLNINKEKYTFDDFTAIISALLGENGCPWDRAQTHDSVMECLIEECYEVIDAVKDKNDEAFCEELGDVLLQVVFNAEIAKKRNSFAIDGVIDGIAKKMISRHPHVFGTAEAENKEQVLDIWEENKRKEKGYHSVKESMESVPKTFPALMRAQKVLKKAAKATDQNKDISDFIDDALIELLELKISLKTENCVPLDKYGELLLTIADISRILKINPELALTNAIETYINKFEHFDIASERK